MGIFSNLFKRNEVQQRTVDSIGLIQMMSSFGSGGKFVAVTPRKSASLGVVFECLDVITRTLSLVSPKVIENKGRGKSIAYKHPLFNVLNRNPYTLYSASKFYNTIAVHYYLFGNAYVEIIRSGSKVTGLKIHEPDEVDVEILKIDGIEEHWYKLTDSKEGGRVLNQKDVLHFMDFSIDGVKGLSRISLKANTLKNSGNIQNYASDMYENGANISGYIYGDRAVTPEALEYLKQKFEDKHTSKNGGVAALPNGFKYEPLQYNIPFADAQIIEGSKFAVEDVARIFGVPLSLLGRGESADNKANMEYNTFLTTTIAPLVMMIESEINRKLFENPENYLKFELKGLYRVDMEARYRAHQIALNAGFMNKDEVRYVEDMNPIEGGLGQTYYQPLNTIPLQKAEEYFDNVILNGKSKEVNNDNTGI
jgi:HK97 family phage portal protein